MKKYLVLMLSVLMCLSVCLFGCEEKATSPEISFDPEILEMSAGADIDLLTGVTVSDRYDENLSATVSNLGGFDREKPGTYTVEYSATNSKGKTSVKERTVRVSDFSAPVVKAVPAEMTIHAGDEFELLIGVSVEDAYDENLQAIVSDDGGFDPEVQGVYTLTYSATNSKGKTGTATRTVTVEAPLPRFVLEVRQALDPNWPDKEFMYFKNDQVITLEQTPEAAFEIGNYVFYNGSDQTVVVSVLGTHGEAAVFNAGGAMIQGRDGANGKLCDRDNPLRTSSTATSFTYAGESYPITANFAMYMEIPAKGFAVVIQNSGGFDEDGRAFLNKNLIYQYLTPAKFYFEDGEGIHSTYIDMAPTVTGNTALTVMQGNESFDPAAELVKGLIVKDDNGTFELSDDVTLNAAKCVAVVEGQDAFDVHTLGDYTFLLTATDANGNAAEFFRVVTVVEATPTTPTLILDGKIYSLDMNKVLVNQAGNAGKNPDVAIYTSFYSGSRFVNNFGAYVIVGADGIVKEQYEPWNNKKKYYGEDKSVVSVDGVSSNILSQASELAAGEYIVMFPNGGAFRDVFKEQISASGYLALGMKLELYVVDIWPKLTVNGSSFTFDPTKILINQAAADATQASRQQLMIYDHTYDFVNQPLVCNGYGIAVVLDAGGRIKFCFDGISAKLINEEFPTPTAQTQQNKEITPNNFYQGLQTLGYTLQEGELFLIFPNGGDNSHRGFANTNMRYYGRSVYMENLSAYSIGIRAGSAVYYVSADRLLVNQPTEGKSANQMLLVYTNAFGETAPDVNGYGVAAVISAEGKIVRVYDGANARFRDEANPSGVALEGMTASNYAQVAYESLQDGEILVITPHSGGDNATNPRQFGGDALRTVGAAVTLLGFTA